MQEQMVKVYNSFGSWNRATHKFQSDAKQLALQGWSIQSQSAMRSTGMFTPKRATVTLVYVRTISPPKSNLQWGCLEYRLLNEQYSFLQLIRKKQPSANKAVVTRLHGENTHQTHRPIDCMCCPRIAQYSHRLGHLPRKTSGCS